MKKIAQTLSALALAATLVPSLLFFADLLALAQVKVWMLVAALLWFVSAPLCMERKTTQ